MMQNPASSSSNKNKSKNSWNHDPSSLSNNNEKSIGVEMNGFNDANINPLAGGNMIAKITSLKMHAKEAKIKTRENLSKHFTVQQLKRRTLLNIHAKDVVVGIPLTKNRLSVAMWVFFIYYLYPIGPLYVLFKHGKIPFNNLGFGCTSIQNIVTNHLPFIINLLAFIWIQIDKEAEKAYSTEVLFLWFSQLARMVGIAVKYSHCDDLFLNAFLNCEDPAAVKEASSDLMLTTGWFCPTLKQWLPVIDRAEHTANISFFIFI